MKWTCTQCGVEMDDLDEGVSVVEWMRDHFHGDKASMDVSG